MVRLPLLPTHRPLAAAAVIALLCTLLSWATMPTNVRADETTDANEQEFLELVNAERFDAGLSALAIRPQVRSASASWSEEMIRRNQLDHDPNHASTTAGARTAYETYHGAAENIGQGSSVASLHNAFVTSSVHYKNMTGDYSHIGIGVRRDAQGTLWVTVRYGRFVDSRAGNGVDSVAIRRDGIWHLRRSNTSGVADITYAFGDPDGTGVMGDWNGDGIDTPAVRVSNEFALRNANAAGPADARFAYGKTTDSIFVGDWDGDGKDTLAVRRGNHYFFRNDLRGGTAEVDIHYGRTHDLAYVGDWDGDGKDTIAVRRGNHFFFRNDLRSGNATSEVHYGKATDKVVIGDWDGDGDDSLGVHRGNSYYLRNALSSGVADHTFGYGHPSDEFHSGDF